MSGKCIVCGNDKGRNKSFCSQKCRTEFLKNKKICIICGKTFYAPPSSGKITCSLECEKQNRSNKMKNNRMNEKILEKAHQAAKVSPNSAAVETNSKAKSWVIVSPTGEKYEVNNLALWARIHSSILPSTPKQFSDGIRGIKQTLLGQKKKGASSYKGWKLESFFEENLAREGVSAPSKRGKRHKINESERLRRKRERAKIAYSNKKNRHLRV